MSTKSSSKSLNESSELEEVASGADGEVDNDSGGGSAADESNSAGGSSIENVKRADDGTESPTDDAGDHEVKHADSPTDCKSDGGWSGDDSQDSVRTDRFRESTSSAYERAFTDGDSLDAPPDVGVSHKADATSTDDVADGSQVNQGNCDVVENRESRGRSDTREDTHVTDTTRDVGWDHESPRNMTTNDEDGDKVGAEDTSSCSKDGVRSRSREQSPPRLTSNLSETSQLGPPAGRQPSPGSALDGKAGINPTTPPSESSPRDASAVNLCPGDRLSSNDAGHDPPPATTIEARDDKCDEFSNRLVKLRDVENESQTRETTREYHEELSAQEVGGMLRAKTPANHGVEADQGTSMRVDLRDSTPADQGTRCSRPDGDGTTVFASGPGSYSCASQGDGDDTDGEDTARAFCNSSGYANGTNACEDPMLSPRVVDDRDNRSSDDSTGRNGRVEQQEAAKLAQTAAERKWVVNQDIVQPASGTDSKRPSGEPLANTGETSGDDGRGEKPEDGRLAARERYNNYRSSESDQGARHSRSGANDREITGPQRSHNTGHTTGNRRLESRTASPESIAIFAPGVSQHAMSCSSSPPSIGSVSPGKAAATAAATAASAAATAAAASVRAAEAAVDAAEAAKVAADVEEQASPARSGFSVARDSRDEDEDRSLRGSPKAPAGTLAPMKRDYEEYDIGRGRRQGRFNRRVLDAGTGDQDGHRHRRKNIVRSEDEKLKRAREQARVYDRDRRARVLAREEESRRELEAIQTDLKRAEEERARQEIVERAALEAKRARVLEDMNRRQGRLRRLQREEGRRKRRRSVCSDTLPPSTDNNPSPVEERRTEYEPFGRVDPSRGRPSEDGSPLSLPPVIGGGSYRAGAREQPPELRRPRHISVFRQRILEERRAQKTEEALKRKEAEEKLCRQADYSAKIRARAKRAIDAEQRRAQEEATLAPRATQTGTPGTSTTRTPVAIVQPSREGHSGVFSYARAQRRAIGRYETRSDSVMCGASVGSSTSSIPLRVPASIQRTRHTPAGMSGESVPFAAGGNGNSVDDARRAPRRRRVQHQPRHLRPGFDTDGDFSGNDQDGVFVGRRGRLTRLHHSNPPLRRIDSQSRPGDALSRPFEAEPSTHRIEVGSSFDATDEGRHGRRVELRGLSQRAEEVYEGYRARLEAIERRLEGVGLAERTSIHQPGGHNGSTGRELPPVYRGIGEGAAAEERFVGARSTNERGSTRGGGVELEGSSIMHTGSIDSAMGHRRPGEP